MNKEFRIIVLAVSISTAFFLQGCGNTSSEKDGNTSRGGNMGNSNTQNEAEGSNIPYLRDNHAKYKEHGSSSTPAPTKDASKKSIDWTIAASSKEGAEKLAGHIRFMDAQLKADKNPRAFDKLFLMEAYMKYNGYYTTSVEQAGTSVVVSKKANTTCAYEVISTHSNAVSGDFFAQGEIMNDSSGIAENILASSACDGVRGDVESYISQRKKNRGKGH